MMSTTKVTNTTCGETSKISNITQSLDAIGDMIHQLHSKKRQILADHNQTIQRHIHNIKNTIINLLLPIASSSSDKPTQPKPTGENQSYSQAVTKNMKRPQPTTVFIKTPSNSDSDTSKTKSTIENSITELLHTNEIEATMVKCKNTQSGNLKIQFEPSDDVNKIGEVIQNNLGYEAKGRPLISPKITVSHIPSHIDLTNITNEILLSNPWLKQHSIGFEVLFTYTNRDFGSAVCKVSPEVRQKIFESSGALKIGARACPVKDRFHILQCRNCSRFGHSTSKCKAENPNCTHCAKNHQHSSCPHKQHLPSDKVHLRCFNCLSSTETSSSAEHSATDHDCPQYRSQLIRLWNRTNWGSGPSPLDNIRRPLTSPRQ